MQPSPSRYGGGPSRTAPPRRRLRSVQATEGLFDSIPIVGGLLDGIFGGGGGQQQQQNGGGGGGLGGLLGGLAPLAGTLLGGPLGGMAGGLLGNLLGGGGGQQGAAGNPLAALMGAGMQNPAALMQLMQGGMGLAQGMNPTQMMQLLQMFGPVANGAGQMLAPAQVAQAMAPQLAQTAATTVAAVSPQLDALLAASNADQMRQQATAEHRQIQQTDQRHRELMGAIGDVQRRVTVMAPVDVPRRF